jgi:orotate phosphoribosyltransferase
LLYTGALLSTTGDALAEMITSSRIPKFDVLFGPAYKGISFAAITAVALSKDKGVEVGYAYNRKEKKDVSGRGVA